MTDFLYNINKEQLLRNNLQQFYEGGEDNYKYFFELYNYLMEYCNLNKYKNLELLLEKLNITDSCKKVLPKKEYPINVPPINVPLKKELIKKDTPKKDTPIKEKYKKKCMA